MKIYITKPCPHDFCFAGADRCRIWFTKPVFTKPMTVCSMFGLMKPKDFRCPEWQGQEGFNLKVLRKLQTPLFMKIWEDIKSTYKDPNYSIIDDKYHKASKVFTEKNHINTALGQHSTKLSEALHFHININREIFCEQAIESDSWREWIGEYDIEMTLA